MHSIPLFIGAVFFTCPRLIRRIRFNGVMVAAVCVMTYSLPPSAARALYGHLADGSYVPGYFDISSKL